MSVSLLCVCDALAPSVSFISDILKVLCIYIYTSVRSFFVFLALGFSGPVCFMFVLFQEICVHYFFKYFLPPHLCLSRIALIQMLFPLLSPTSLRFSFTFLISSVFLL